MDFVKPTLEYAELSPLLIVFGVACLGVLVEAFLPRSMRRNAQLVLAVVGLVSALAATVWVGLDLTERAGGAAYGTLAIEGALAIDGPTIFMWGLLLIVALAGLLLFAERQLDNGVSAFAGQAAALPGTEAERQASSKGVEHTEVYPLLMLAMVGMLLFPAANDLLTMFVGLEVLSLPLYLLTGLARRRRLLSQEAAMKYFLLGAFSSGFFIYGVALVYGYAGTMEFAGISAAITNRTGSTTMLVIGLGLISVGLLFKVGAVPFQSWTPDVYQGAPTPVTAFMAAATKIAAFGALLRLYYVGFAGEQWTWQPMLWVIAILSMLGGAILAIAQSDVKRMLAYSSVAHTGFLLTGVLGVQSTGQLADSEITSLQAVLFYLVTYAFVTVGAFAVVSLVRDAGGEATQLSRWAGIGKESPVVAAIFSLFLLSMAGIPLTAGFTGKWAVFAVAMSAGAWPVVVVAVATSAIAAAFYLRVIVVMYFSERSENTASVTVPSTLTAAAIAFGVAATVLLGIVPGPVLDLAANAGQFIR